MSGFECSRDVNGI